MEEHVLDLDKPVATYLKKPWREYPKWAELDSDPRAASITPRMLLSHTSGFANFRFLNPGEKLQIWFQPGSRYAYSGEGLNLLQFVIEEITGEPLDRMMQRRVFDRFGMKSTSMVWRDDFAANLAMGHDEQGAVLGHNRRSGARAAGSMDTTQEDYSRFARGFSKQGTALLVMTNSSNGDSIFKELLDSKSFSEFSIGPDERRDFRRIIPGRIGAIVGSLDDANALG